MPMQIIEQPVAPETTHKAREVEGVLDLYFYRKIGYWLAQVFARLKITPAGVSLLGCLFGVIAGHLYFYRSLGINVAGMALHVCANALDNADGQLARLTGAGSQPTSRYSAKSPASSSPRSSHFGRVSSPTALCWPR